MNWFLTGTDTGVGKTHVTCLLLRALRATGLSAAGFKPFCCGDRTDAHHLHAAGDPAALLDLINPVWFRTPAAPYTAGLVENRLPDLALIREAFATFRSRFDSVLVEGVGGWLTPITREMALADLAEEFALPVVVVVANRLGALNHTLLTVENIRARGLACAGLILNTLPGPDDVAIHTNRAVLEDLTSLPVLFDISPGQSEIELGLA